VAKYRLTLPHELEVQDGSQRVFVDAETEVGDGTAYRVRWPTLDMTALDSEAEAMIEKEKERLARNQAISNPVEEGPADPYEENYIPGSPGRRRKPAAADGT
jgi:hypothetical protein